MDMVQQGYKYLDKVSLKSLMDEVRDEKPNMYKDINVRLMMAFHLLQICDKYFAEIEDNLQNINEYRFEIKRNHKKIAKEIHDSYMPLFKNLHGCDLGEMYIDNLELEDVINCWAGFDKKRKAIVQEIPTDGEAVKVYRNPAGDLVLFNNDGWQILIPKQFDKAINVNQDIMAQIENGERVSCGVNIWIGKEVE